VKDIPALGSIEVSSDVIPTSRCQIARSQTAASSRLAKFWHYGSTSEEKGIQMRYKGSMAAAGLLTASPAFMGQAKADGEGARTMSGGA